MALSPKELSDFVAKMIPGDLAEDPEESFRPPEARGHTLVRRSDQRTSRGAGTLPIFTLERGKVEEHKRKKRESSGEVEVPAISPAGYGLLTLVGEGGFGEVWEAIQMSLGRIVAVKRMGRKMLTELKDDPGELRKVEEDFNREALTTALLEHPNIIPVHDLGLDEDGRPLLAMKMVRGERWDDLLYEDLVKQTPEDVLSRHLPILIDVAQAVAFAHSRGIVHRDIKPSQVMVGEFGETLLMDWGIAVLYNPGLLDEDCKQLVDEIAPTVDKAFNPTGTPAYMAPEQTTKSALHIGPWTDIYLLGGILYYLLTGRSPHSAANSRESFTLAAQGHVHPPQEMAPGREMPRELVAIALKAMSAKPSERHGTVKDFIAALRDYMTGAGNRHRSMELTRQVAEHVDKGMEGYEELTECHNMVIQAASLWPQNPMAASLQTKVRTAYAEAALRNDDLVLARLMAQAITDEDSRRPLMAEVTARERRTRWNTRFRRIFFGVALVLVLIVMFNVLFYIAWQRSEGIAALQKRAEEAEARAAAAELTLEKLVGSPQEKPTEAPPPEPE